MKIKIFSVYYGKNNYILKDNIITPIQGGAIIEDNELIELNDAICPEISKKNPIINEFSVLYVIWKYYSNNLEYVGLCHYRRYFVLKRYKYFFEMLVRILKKTVGYEYFIKKTNIYIEKNIDKIDGIVPKLKKIGCTIKEHYKKNHIKEHYEIFEDVIKNDFKFLEHLLEYSSNRKKGYFLNIFILKKDIFDKYCENVFKFLEIIEKRIDIPLENSYQKRVLGFLGERFTNLYFIYLNKNGINLREYPIINIEKE